MTLRDIGSRLLRRWPIIGIFVVIAALVGGFAFGTFYSDGNLRILAQDPAPTPTLSFVVNTPTDAELDEMKAEYIKTLTSTPRARSRSAAAAVPTPTFTVAEQIQEYRMYARSQAEFEYWMSDRERAIYLEELDRVIHLPDSVVDLSIYDDRPYPPQYWCGAPDRPIPRCPVAPVYDLDMGEYTISVDSTGRVFLDDGETLPSFLSGLKVLYWPW